MAKLKLSVVVLLCLIASFSVQSINGLVLDKRQEGGAVGEVVDIVQSVVSSPPPSTSAPSQQTETPKAPPAEDPPVSTTPSPPADSPTPPPATSPSPPPVVVPETPKEPAPAPALPKAPKKKERPQPPVTPPNPLPPATPANPPAGQPANPPAGQPANPPAGQPANQPAGQPANPQPPVQPNPGQNQGQQAPATPISGDGTLRQASVPPPGTPSSAPAGGTPAGGSQNAPNSDPNTPNGGGNPSPSSPEIASPKIPVPVSDSGPSGDQKGDLFNVGPGSPDSAGQTSQGGSGVVIVGTIIGVVIAAALVSLFVNRSRILNAWKKDDVKKGTKGSASKPRVDSFPTFPVLGSYGESKNERPETLHSFGGNPAASDLGGSNVHGNREQVVSGVAQEREFQHLALSHIPANETTSENYKFNSADFDNEFAALRDHMNRHSQMSYSDRTFNPVDDRPSSPSSSGTAATTTLIPQSEQQDFTCHLGYSPQLDDELALSPGDIVRVEQVFNDNWAVGVNTATDERGVFPFACVDPEYEGRPMSGESFTSSGMEENTDNTFVNLKEDDDSVDSFFEEDESQGKRTLERKERHSIVQVNDGESEVNNLSGRDSTIHPITMSMVGPKMSYEGGEDEDEKKVLPKPRFSTVFNFSKRIDSWAGSEFSWTGHENARLTIVTNADAELNA